MSLSHEPASLPSHHLTEAFNHLQKSLNTQLKRAQQRELFEGIEKAVHAAFMEAERAALAAMLASYDIDLPVLTIGNKTYRRVLHSEKNYTSVAGKIRVKRTRYRLPGTTISISPLECRAGIVESSWTPNAAKQAMLVVSQLTPYDAADLFSELGAMQPSKSSLDRLPKKLGLQWEKQQTEFELQLRQQFEIPKEAVALAVSLDGVLIPMQGAVVMPGDSRYEEASCGSVTYYDDQGEPLVIRRYGCMPEHKKMTLKNFLQQEVEYALAQRPELTLIKVADGAKDNWTFLDGALAVGTSVLDFYHAAEHLKKAFEIIYGVKSLKASSAFVKYRHILRHDENGIQKIIAHLRYQLSKQPGKASLKTELNYFKNNKHRCHYAELAASNLPIGSGIVEATCKALVSQRLKRSGMCWKEVGGQAILTFRGLLLSNLFNQGWDLLMATYQKNISLPDNVVLWQKQAA